jgi:PAS domain S-box-containing protein
LFIFNLEGLVGIHPVLESNTPDLASLEIELAVRARQQAVVAHLGQRALSGVAMQTLLDEAVQLLAQTLGIEYCEILQLLPEGEKLLLVSGVGWKEGYVGRATVDAVPDSQADYTLASKEAVVLEDLQIETRFSGASLLAEHGIVSGMSVVIQGWARPFGVLGAYTSQRRDFNRDDVNFLQSIANIIAAAHHRKMVEDSLIALNATLEKRVEQGIGYVRLLKEVAVFANESLSVEEALQFVIERVCTYTGWPVGHVYRPATSSSEAPYSQNMPGQVSTLIPTGLWYLQDSEKFETFRRVTEKTLLAPGEGLIGRVYSNARPAWIKNVLDYPDFTRANLVSDLGVKSGFAFPVLVGKDVAAVLEFFSDQEYEPDQELLEVMAQIGTQIGRVVERSRAESELNHKQMQLEEAQRLTHIGSWDWDITTNRVRWSDELYRIYGLDPAEFKATYESFLERVHPEDRELVTKEIDKALTDRQPFGFKHRIILANGSTRILHALGKVILDDQGNPVRMVGTGQDLTERVKLEEALHRSIELLEGLFEAAPDGIVLVDQEGTIIRLNRQVEALFGYDRGELLGKSLEILMPDRFQKVHVLHRANYYQEPRRRPMGIELDLFGRRKDGSEFPVDIVLSPLSTEQGLLVIGMIRDVTSQVQAAEMLRQSEAHFRSLIENGQDIISILDDHGTILYESPSIERVMGYEPGEIIGKSIFDFIHLEDFPGASEVFSECLSKPGISFGIVLRFQHRDGSWRVQDTTVKNLLDEPAVKGVVVNSRDITEQRQVEEALRHSEARFRTIFESAHLGIAVVGLDKRILVANPRLENMLGYENAELNGKDLISLTHPDDVKIADNLLEKLLSGESEHYNLEKRFMHKDGQFMWGSFTVSLVRDAEGNPRFAIKMVEDITARKQMEGELAEVQQRLLEGRELERMQLAQELHDVPIQDLYGVLYQLNDFNHLILDREISDEWANVRGTIQDVINTLRGICGELRSPTLAPFGLEGAIREHAEQFQNKHPHIDVRLDLKHDGKALPEQIRLNLFRIYQQAMTNIIRHAEATLVSVSFTWDEEQVILQVQDNGRGFEIPPRWIGLVRKGHLGLVGAAERAELIGGSFQVVSKPGEGTLIKVTVPRNQKQTKTRSALLE